MGVNHHGSASKNPVKAAFRLGKFIAIIAISANLLPSLRLVQQVWDQPVTVTACDRFDKATSITFRYIDVIGNGTFGIVCRARDLTNGEIVAVKTVFQDEGHQNRELSIIKGLQHENIVGLKYYFYTRNEYGEDFLSLVLEYMPSSMDRLLRDYERQPDTISLTLIRRAFQQFAQALEYLHGQGVCHRDIKPHNLLLDPRTGAVKLCDFGCSKRLNRQEANIQYICARYYRAPEIVLGWAHYSTAIDLWSAGCVLAELLLGKPIFPGKNSIDQLAKIIKVLGSPSPEEMRAMGQEPKKLGLRDPLGIDGRKSALRNLFSNGPSTIPEDAIDIICGLLHYDPDQRLTPPQLLAHPFLLNIPSLSSNEDGVLAPGIREFILEEKGKEEKGDIVNGSNNRPTLAQPS